jgi:hypothetical protein
MLAAIGVGLLQAATPLGFWWLDSATVYALGLVAIAPVYVGFAVADGRDHRRREQRGLRVRRRGRRRRRRITLAARRGARRPRTQRPLAAPPWPPFCMVVAANRPEIASGMHFG